jgi:hypothetical protein
MVEIASSEPMVVFRVRDRDGRAIGEVVQPRAAPIMERGAGTVLLVRGNSNGAGTAPGC